MRKSRRPEPFVKAFARGLAAGVGGTAAMTMQQLLVSKLRGEPLKTPVPKTWADAPAPALAVKKIADATGHGARVTKQEVPTITNLAHWAYGIGLGTVYGIATRRLRPRLPVGAVALGAFAWSLSYAELVPLGVYKPPWRYPVGELAVDLSYHLMFGIGVAATIAALES
jgi:hypothetical protein